MPAETQHTSEPWDIVPASRHPTGTLRRDIVTLSGQFSPAFVAGDVLDPDARRIVACVNACKGINPEAVPELMRLARQIMLEYEDLEYSSDIPGGIYKSARSAIRKAANQS